MYIAWTKKLFSLWKTCNRFKAISGKKSFLFKLLTISLKLTENKFLFFKNFANNFYWDETLTAVTFKNTSIQGLRHFGMLIVSNFCNTQLFNGGGQYHIETSTLICRANRDLRHRDLRHEMFWRAWPSLIRLTKLNY